MFRGDNNPLLAIFRRRNNARDLTLATAVTEDADEQQQQQSTEHPGSIEAEEKEEAESDVSFMTHLMINHTKSFDEYCDSEPEGEEEEDDDDDHKPPAFPLKANPVRDSLDGSSCSQLLFDCDSSSANCSTEAGAKDSAAKKAKRQPKKTWMNEAAKLGWTPGHIKVSGEDRFVLEPVVALTDNLEDISLDDSIIRAMAGKRGSFSSEISAVTQESNESEGKRTRVWASVFRRGGSRT